MVGEEAGLDGLYGFLGELASDAGPVLVNDGDGGVVKAGELLGSVGFVLVPSPFGLTGARRGDEGPIASSLGLGDALGWFHAGHGREGEGPGAGNGLHIIPPSAEGDPAWEPGGDLLDDGEVALGREAHVGERIAVVSVHAELGDHEVGLEGLEHRDDGFAEGPQVAVVVGVRRQGQVDGEALAFPVADLLHFTG